MEFNPNQGISQGKMTKNSRKVSENDLHLFERIFSLNSVYITLNIYFYLEKNEVFRQKIHEIYFIFTIYFNHNSGNNN